MAQKVISVNVVSGTENSYFMEMEFPQVKEALDAGFIVQQVISTTPTYGASYINLTFILSTP